MKRSIALLLVSALFGCSSSTEPTQPTPSVSTIEASSRSATSVALRWSPAEGATSYRVRWESIVGTASGGLAVEDDSAVVAGLPAGEACRFAVAARSNGIWSDDIEIEWAGARRYTTTLEGFALRLYEPASSRASALRLDPGGPVTVDIAAPDMAQVAWTIHPRDSVMPDSIVIGAIAALPEYTMQMPPAGKLDTTVRVSTSTYLQRSLDDWFLSAPLSSALTSLRLGSSYTLTPSHLAESHGFAVRIGRPGGHRYARVLVKAVRGSILQGTAPDRYIELEISYQATPNVPYA
jgi:hypothetical protein